MADPIAPVIDRFVSQGSVAGASLLLLRDGREVYDCGVWMQKSTQVFYA